jgi:hypothetical protein
LKELLTTNLCCVVDIFLEFSELPLSQGLPGRPRSHV